jgi:glycosyltransferase involved in cell wall biosynthesis
LIPLILKNEYLPGVTSAWNQANGKKAKAKAVIRSVFYTLKYKKYYSNYKASDQIISISEATKQSFIERLGINSEKIRTLPLAPVSSTNRVDASISKTILKPYLFYIGGTDSRKRVEEIVYAFNIMKGRGHDISLVLAGNEFKKLTMLPSVVTRNAILDSPYRKDIHLVGFVTDAEKAGLYKNAAAFLFTSAYEGFGLPVVEAAAAGCPVVAYSNSSIPEAIGDAALLVETGDYTAAANAAISLLDATSRDKIVERGIKQTKKYSWEKFTASFLGLLND